MVCVSSSCRSAFLMTFRIGVRPLPSRNTPTPTSIFSGEVRVAEGDQRKEGIRFDGR